MSLIEYQPFNDLGKITESSQEISRILGIPKTCCIMGTGFYPENPPWEEVRKVPCGDIPHFPKRENTYHDPELVLASSGGKEFFIMTGRYHFYEGFSMQEVGYPARVLAHCGVKTLLITSACGGVNPEYQVGDYVIVENHVNLTGLNPLIGANLDAIGPRFPNLLEGYTPTLINHIEKCGKEAGLNIKRGVLGFLPGPYFETRAELEFLQRNNIDLIGWSSVPEAIVAMHAGLQVVSVVVVSDISDPSTAYKVSVEEVLQGAQKNRDIFVKTLNLFVTRL